MADLLVRRECNTDLSVRDILPQQALRHGHDFGDARLIVRSQQSRSVRDDKRAPGKSRQMREHGRRQDAPAVAQYYFPTVILRDQAGTNPFPVEVRGSVHMCNKAQRRAILIPRCGRNDAVHVAGVGKAHCRDAEFCHLIAESLCQYQLAGGRGNRCGFLVAGRPKCHVLQKAFICFHFRLVLSLRVHRSPLSPLLYPMFTKKARLFCRSRRRSQTRFPNRKPPARAMATLFQQGVFSNPLHFPCRYGRMGRKNGCNREEARL